MTYSFCTICKGRLHNLKETLPLNLAYAKQKYPNFEFVILDYDSPDGLRKWIERRFFLPSFRKNHIKYGRFIAGPYLHLSHAKNLAHKIASGDILINLDADNMLSQSYIDELLNVFEGPDSSRSLLCSNYNSSITGRIALPRDMFFALKGYDETFSFYGYEDIDLIERARLFGAQIVQSDGANWRAIINTVQEKWQYFNTETIFDSTTLNREISLARLAKGEYTGNVGRWGQGRVQINCRVN